MASVEVTTEAEVIELYGKYPGRTEAVKDRLEYIFKKYSSFNIEAEIAAVLSAEIVQDIDKVVDLDLDLDIYVTPPQAVEFIEVPISEAANEAQMEKVEVKPFTIHLPGIVKAERPRALFRCAHGGLPEKVEDVIRLEAEFLREDFLRVFTFETTLASFRDEFVRFGGRKFITTHEDLFQGFLWHNGGGCGHDVS